MMLPYEILPAAIKPRLGLDCAMNAKYKWIIQITKKRLDRAVMWWGENLDCLTELDIPERATGSGKTFSLPWLCFDELDNNIDLLHGMELDAGRRLDRKLDILPPTIDLAALPAPSSDPLEAFETVGHPRQSETDDYWSASKSFWLKWRSDETSKQKESLEKAKLQLGDSQKQAASAAAALARDAENERIEKEKAKRASDAQKEKANQMSINSVPPKQTTDISSESTQLEEYVKLMEEGRTFRSEFMQIWRDISLAVSTTAGNARSIQLNASKLIASLSKVVSQAGQRGPLVQSWMSAVCGSKIVSQASSGNKILVWAFAYLARIVGEKFPEVIRIGIIGELMKECGQVLTGIPGVKPSGNPQGSVKQFEIYGRILVAVLCVCGDDISLWAWAAHALNSLSSCKNFVNSSEAMWNMMKIYVLIDMGLYDFKRIFGSQTSILVTSLETLVLPAMAKELGALPRSTESSVQLKYYLDACYNNLHGRKYMQPPEGQILSAIKETELNPEL